MSLIKDSRLKQIDSLLFFENALYYLSRNVYDINKILTNDQPHLAKTVSSDIYRAYQLLDKAHDTIYKHNINLNLCYEDE